MLGSHAWLRRCLSYEDHRVRRWDAEKDGEPGRCVGEKKGAADGKDDFHPWKEGVEDGRG